MATTTTRRVGLLQLCIFQRGHVLWRDLFRFAVLAHKCRCDFRDRDRSNYRRRNNLLFLLLVTLWTRWIVPTPPLLYRGRNGACALHAC